MIKSRTTGNVDIGSKRTGCSNWSTNAEHDLRAYPLITIEHAPHTSSKQFISHLTGVVFLPSAVTGFFRISINPEITFIFGRYGISKVSSSVAESGSSCRVTINVTVF